MALSSLNVITLLNLKGIGPKAILKIGAAVESKKIETTEQLYQTLQDLKIKKGSITMDELLDAEETARSIIRRSEKNGIGVVSYYDDEFPEILRHCMNEDGKEDPPVVLYYKGDLSVTKMPGLAVIGTREMIKEGESAGKYLAGEFAKRGFCIVSGLAIGCDTSGHRGALDAGGKTIAFLAHGLDTVYPPENTDLAKQAGMSLATLVVHTGIQGGTMHAVNTTIVENKPVYVVKFQNGQLHNHENVQGNDYLVEKKGAKYISGADNIDDIVKSINTRRQFQSTLF